MSDLAKTVDDHARRILGESVPWAMGPGSTRVPAPPLLEEIDKALASTLPSEANDGPLTVNESLPWMKRPDVVARLCVCEPRPIPREPHEHYSECPLHAPIFVLSSPDCTKACPPGVRAHTTPSPFQPCSECGAVSAALMMVTVAGRERMVCGACAEEIKQPALKGGPVMPMSPKDVDKMFTRSAEALRRLLAPTTEPVGGVHVADDGYGALRRVLERAVEQASVGKGKERHATGDEPFEQQQIVKIGEWLGSPHFEIGQAVKKALESERLPHDRAVGELLGAINYLAAAVIVRDRLHYSTDVPA